MKTHEQKMHEKKAHEAELERNDLYAWLLKFWTKLRTGEIVSRKFALIALGVGVAVAAVILLTRGGSSSEAAAWQKLEATTGTEALSDFAKSAPNTMPGKAARLQVARQLLGPQGVGQLGALDASTRGKAIKSIEDAREAFTKLIDEFKDDLTLQAMAIDGAAHAELALVGIPQENNPAEYRGSVDKAIELFRQYAKLAGESAGESAKKMADQLQAEKDRVLQLCIDMNTRKMPQQTKQDFAIPNLPSLTPAPAAPTPPK